MRYLNIIQSSWNIAKNLFRALSSILCELFLISLLLVFIMELLSMGISIFIPVIIAPLAYLYYIVISRMKETTTKFQALIIVGFPVLSVLMTSLLYVSIITDKLLKLVITYLSMLFAYVILITIYFLANTLISLFTLMHRHLEKKI